LGAVYAEIDRTPYVFLSDLLALGNHSWGEFDVKMELRLDGRKNL
jgi:hypothetical protein